MCRAIRAQTSDRVSVRLIVLHCLGWAFAFAVAPLADAQDSQVPDTTSVEQLWFGTMTVKDVRQFRFLLKLTQQEEVWSGVLTSLDEGGRRFQMSSIVCTANELKFELPISSAAYQSRWDDATSNMQGKWQQRGQEFGLAFRRVKALPGRSVKTVWKGTINAVIQQLEVAFVELKTGQLLFDSLSQKAGGFLAKDESNPGEVIYRVPAVQGTFRGELSEDQSQIVGKWSQGLAKLDLVLKKGVAGDLVAKKPARPQTPKPPFPYLTREISFASTAKEVTLSGTLTIPPAKKVQAGVVLVSGSGPQDRDESLLGHKPFWVIADHFARHGIAVLRYDDRGTGRSTGDFGRATSWDFADDAEAALTHLRSLPELQGQPVGICGHSEGGMIAALVAARNMNVDFIVMLAGTGVNGEQILYSQTRLMLEAEGVPEKEIQKQVAFQRALLSQVVQHPEASKDELEVKVNRALQQVFTNDELQDDEWAKMVQAGVEKVATPWFRTFLTLEPTESLAKCQCPVLVLQGEKDIQVDSQLNLPPIRAALQRARNRHVEIVEFSGLNHLFQACRTGAVSEYEKIEETLNPQPLLKMTEWILAAKNRK